MVAANDPDGAAAVARQLAEWQWRHWRGELATKEMTAEAFRAVALGYQREIWLWARGDRSFEQMIDGLRGRVLRRLG